MRKTVAVAVAAAVGLVIAAPAGAHYSRPLSSPMDSEIHSCRGMNFAPASDWGAGDIEAGNLPCRAARRLVRRVSLRQGGPSNWSCQHRVRQLGDGYNGQAHTDYRCRSGRRFVTWMVT